MKILLITILFFHSYLNSQDSGYQMYRDGDINSALQYYNTLLEMDNEDISKESLLYNIGTIYSSMNNIPEANSVFQKAYSDSLKNFILTQYQSLRRSIPKNLYDRITNTFFDSTGYCSYLWITRRF